MEPQRGIEPRSSVYKTVALPLSYKGKWNAVRESDPRVQLGRLVPSH